MDAHPNTSSHISLPVGDQEFHVLLESLGPFEPHPYIAVALSGGSDSLALTLLLNAWIQKQGGKLHAVCIDHGLRPESGKETEILKGWMEQKGILCSVLKWEGAKPISHIQEKARFARHALLEEFCQKNNILHLFFAHHKEDQAETFLGRLLKKSGLDGLASMRPLQESSFGRKIRPLLQISKSRLQATLAAYDQPFLQDPSNENLSFQRVRLRAQKDEFENLGITTDVIEALVQKNAWGREALEKETVRALFSAVQISSLGYIRLSLEEFQAVSFDIARRVLERCLLLMGGHSYSPRLENLLPLVNLLRDSPDVSRKAVTKTLHHALVKKRGRFIFIIKETMKEEKEPIFLKEILEKGGGREDFWWKERFLIDLFPKKMERVSHRFIRSVGEEGKIFLKEQEEFQRKQKSAEENVSPEVFEDILATLPSLWEDGKVLSIPHLGWGMSFWEESGFKKAPPSFFPKNALSPNIIYL